VFVLSVRGLVVVADVSTATAASYTLVKYPLPSKSLSGFVKDKLEDVPQGAHWSGQGRRRKGAVTGESDVFQLEVGEQQSGIIHRVTVDVVGTEGGLHIEGIETIGNVVPMTKGGVCEEGYDQVFRGVREVGISPRRGSTLPEENSILD
jgi:hypothetical protein